MVLFNLRTSISAINSGWIIIKGWILSWRKNHPKLYFSFVMLNMAGTRSYRSKTTHTNQQIQGIRGFDASAEKS